jgi:hypothetical protein
LTDQQLYLSIGIPTIVALVGILVNMSYFAVTIERIDSTALRLDNRLVRLEERLKH